MDQQQLRLLKLIASLEQGKPGSEADEYTLAIALGLIPPNFPPHAYTVSSVRARFLTTLDGLASQKFVYVTACGFWRLRLTAEGRAFLAAHETPRPLRPVALSIAPPAATGPYAWEAPRATHIPPTLLTERFTGLALGVATVGAAVIFLISMLAPAALTQRAEAKPAAPATMVITLARVPTAVIPTATVVPAVTPSPPLPAVQAFAVANTGGVGVYLRRSPDLTERIAAWPDHTRLEELGPEVNGGGLTWRHVRAPDGSVGYVPTQYTVALP